MSTKFTENLEFLLSAIRWRVAGENISKSLREFDEIFIWKLANHHDVLPWLWEFTNEFKLGSKEFRQNLATQVRKDGLAGLIRKKELSDLSKSLSEHSIPHLVFKGASIEANFYSKRVSSRNSCDTDLLIQHEHFGEVCRVFATNGYTTHESIDLSKLSKFLKHYPFLYRWRDVGFVKNQNIENHIDLHWNIADTFTLPVSTKSLLMTSSTFNLAGQDIPCLGFNELFVYACVHAHTDYYFRLKYLVDIYCAMNQAEFNLDEVQKLAEAWGVTSAVEKSMATVRLFFTGDSVAHPYADLVMARYVESGGFPKRSHPNTGVWKQSDKLKHIKNQVVFRSQNCAWYEPLVARLKYNHKMLEHWSEVSSPIINYPRIKLKSLFK